MNALLAAISLGDTIEQVGSYFGFAAIVGLGVLSLLYFAQAREVKRLREWAGRAPERDAELAQRVQTDAQKRVVAQPVPPAAAAPGGPQTPAGQQADAARQAAAASLTQQFQNPAGTPVTPATGPPGQLARPGGLGAPAIAQFPAPSPGVGSAGADSLAPGSPKPAAGQPALSSASSPGPPAAPAPATAGAVAAARQAAMASRSPAIANGSGGQDTHESAAARPPQLPDLPSRSARAATAIPGEGEDGRPWKRIGLFAGGAVGGLAIVVVLVLTLTGGSDAPPAANEIEPPSASAPSPPPLALTPTIERKATPVAVLNGTVQTGLAGSVADKIEEQGFTINARDDNDDQTLTTTAVYYADSSEPAAKIVAKIIGAQASAVEAMDANIAAKVDPETKVLVIVGSDVAGAG
ncbi:MAG: LytR C-terminal domain-containing protein [Solirubrobacteraceae bacterium]